jgi:hypothetical protein
MPDISSDFILPTSGGATEDSKEEFPTTKVTERDFGCEVNRRYFLPIRRAVCRDELIEEGK